MTINLTTPALLGALPLLVMADAYADFFKDGKTFIDTRTFYFQNDYRDGPGQNRVEEAAQGLTFRFQSGYTPGVLGFGLEAALMTGFKLDSSPERSGSGLLPRDAQSQPGGPAYAREAQDEYSKLALTAKLRLYRDTEVRSGTLMPDLGVLQPSATRLFTQDFRGTEITNTSLPGLTLKAGRLDRERLRDSTDYEGISIAYANGQYPRTSGGDFDYFAASYRLGQNAGLVYNLARLDDVYRQQFLGFKGKLPAGPGRFVSDVRLFDSRDTGRSEAGRIDNRVYGGQFGYEWRGHTLQVGYQQVDGEGAFPFLDGTATYLLTEMMIANFTKEQERSWLARYDYDFSAVGLPGLLFSVRYTKGDNAEVVGFAGEGRERELDTDLGYTVPQGSLKGLGVRWRHGVMRSNYARGSDQDRVIVEYRFAL